MMTLQTMKNTPGARRRKMRVGCGEGSGKGGTSGRGHKGQYARSGHKHKPAFEGGQMRLIRRIPKRGFNHSVAKRQFSLLAVERLEQFEVGAVVTPESLLAAGLIRKLGDDGVKILGDGALSKKLTVKAQAFSASAKEKIAQAGGVCEVIE